MYQVVDTTTVWVDGIPLRSVSLDAVMDEGVLMGGPMIHYHERIGLLHGLDLNMWCVNDGGNENVRCYSDYEISYHAPDWPEACDIGLFVEQSRHELPTLFPNPGSDNFRIELPQGTHLVAIYDGLGQLVLQQRTTGSQINVETSQMPPGIYSVQVDGTGMVLWMKE
jgi:hypothetical protein